MVLHLLIPQQRYYTFSVLFHQSLCFKSLEIFLDYRLRGLVLVLCSWGNLFTLPMPLSAQEHKWVLVIVKGSLMKCWGEGGGVILLVISCYGNWNKLHLDKPLATSTDLFPIPFILIYYEGSLCFFPFCLPHRLQDQTTQPMVGFLFSFKYC